MNGSDTLLHTIGRALLEALDVSVLCDVVIEASPEFAAAVWKIWDARADHARKCHDLVALASMPDDDTDDVVDEVTQELGLSGRDGQTESIRGYLGLVPGTIRRHFRRPAHPRGLTLPANLPLRNSADILPLLPARLPKHQCADRPWGIGDWELRELLDLTACGEVWKAVNPRLRDCAPVSLRFFTSPAAKALIRGNAAVVLDRVARLGRLPGIVPLQQIHLSADPPCVQYPYLQAADLASLVQEWRETAAAIDPFAVTDLICRIAETLGQLHTLQPPLAHGDLRARNILLMKDTTGRLCGLLANLGLDGLPGLHAHTATLPSENGDGVASIGRDIYSLGLLWYRLLEGDLARPRPGGSSWRRRLAARDLPASLVEILESCIDDDPDARPANGTVLAGAIRQVRASSSFVRMPSARLAHA